MPCPPARPAIGPRSSSSLPTCRDTLSMKPSGRSAIGSARALGPEQRAPQALAVHARRRPSTARWSSCYSRRLGRVPGSLDVLADPGATGRTGRELVTQALAAGHKVVAYVRKPDAVTPASGLTVMSGQLDDQASMAEALSGCDAVAVTLGNPISKPGAPLMRIAVPTVIAAARQAGVSRVIVLSALGVGSTLANTRLPYGFGCRTFLASNFRDHLAGESLLDDSGLDWTTIHPSGATVRRAPHAEPHDRGRGERPPDARLAADQSGRCRGGDAGHACGRGHIREAYAHHLGAALIRTIEDITRLVPEAPSWIATAPPSAGTRAGRGCAARRRRAR